MAEATKEKKELDWEPKITFKELVKIMVDYELDLMGLDAPGHGGKNHDQKGMNWTKNQLTMG